jgi:protein SCO1
MMRWALVFALAMLASLAATSFAINSFSSWQQSRHLQEAVAAPSPLPRIGPAPEFTLTAQDGAPVALSDLRGKVVAVTFIFTRCTETCPVLTPMMSFVQDRLGRNFGTRIAFISVTVDPERDTPEVLKEYAQSFGADPTGWFFVTGEPDAIREVTRRYGVFASKAADGNVEHTFLTAIVDKRGVLRVQHLDARFDPEEFRRDLLTLAEEP